MCCLVFADICWRVWVSVLSHMTWVLPGYCCRLRSISVYSRMTQKCRRLTRQFTKGPRGPGLIDAVNARSVRPLYLLQSGECPLCCADTMKPLINNSITQHSIRKDNPLTILSSNIWYYCFFQSLRDFKYMTVGCCEDFLSGVEHKSISLLILSLFSCPSVWRGWLKT